MCYHLMAYLLEPTWLTLPIWLLPRYNMTCSLSRKRNFFLVSNVCEATPISLFWAPRTSTFWISFHADSHNDNDLFKRPSTAPKQILIHRWGPRTKISALFRRGTYFLFIKKWFGHMLFFQFQSKIVTVLVIKLSHNIYVNSLKRNIN